MTTSGSTTTLTKYERVPGVCSVVIVGSGPSESISYVTTDGLGSVSEALDCNGNVTAQQLYGPYGSGRFALGAMPTAKGYTGQYGDATTGLDYYGARYYDPLVGQFTSADTVDQGGLNRYAYVAGNPETATDPTGQYRCDDTGCKRGGGNGGKGGCTFDCKGTPSGGCTQNCGSCKSNCGGGKGGGGKGGGGKGGGGKGGGGKGKGDPPKPCSDGTYASCNFDSDYGSPSNEAAAVKAAKDVGDNLLIWAAALTALAVLLGAITVEQPWLVFVMTAVIRLVSTLAVEAGLLGAEFEKEADQNITVSNLQTFQYVVGGTIALFTGAVVVLGGFFQGVLSKAVGYVVGGALGFDLFGNIALNGVAQVANALYS